MAEEYREVVQYCGDWIVRDDYKTIAEFSWDGVTEKEAERNARLFAAAPLLLAACQKVISRKKGSFENGWTMQVTGYEMCQIKTAIKAALGEED